MKRVLVVDDDRAVCELLTEALRERGVVAECCTTDAEAYGRLASSPDALVLDINLGAGTTGFDVARQARRLNKRIAVFYVSGAVSAASHKRYGVAGSDFIEKPILPGELADRVVAKLNAAQ